MLSAEAHPRLEQSANARGSATGTRAAVTAGAGATASTLTTSCWAEPLACTSFILDCLPEAHFVKNALIVTRETAPLVRNDQ